MNTMTIYQIYDAPSNIKITPASKHRDWMDTNATRCLPLIIANQHGWVASVTKKVSAYWEGGNDISSIKIRQDENHNAHSHFGNGILTFTVDRIFRLPENYSLYIMGPPNTAKRAIVPLSGIYESDWAPYSFTMNWKFTEPEHTVTFEEDEPFCFFFPIHRDLIENFKIEHKSIKEDPVLHEQLNYWSNIRNEFINRTDRKPEEWQKHYFKGVYPDGSKCPFHNHKTKLRLHE